MTIVWILGGSVGKGTCPTMKCREFEAVIIVHATGANAFGHPVVLHTADGKNSTATAILPQRAQRTQRNVNHSGF